MSYSLLSASFLKFAPIGGTSGEVLRSGSIGPSGLEFAAVCSKDLVAAGTVVRVVARRQSSGGGSGQYLLYATSLTTTHEFGA